MVSTKCKQPQNEILVYFWVGLLFSLHQQCVRASLGLEIQGSVMAGCCSRGKAKAQDSCGSNIGAESRWVLSLHAKVGQGLWDICILPV